MQNGETIPHELYTIKQSRKSSVIEVTANVISGLVVAWLLTYFVLPLWGYQYQVLETIEITCLYSAVSFIRGYLWRRYFNGK